MDSLSGGAVPAISVLPPFSLGVNSERKTFPLWDSFLCLKSRTNVFCFFLFLFVVGLAVFQSILD